MNNVKVPDELRSIPADKLVLPEAIEVCAICQGKGSYEQMYNAGCGCGHFEMEGHCDYCQEIGFRFKLTGDPVSQSLIAQIFSMNKENIDALSESVQLG